MAKKIWQVKAAGDVARLNAGHGTRRRSGLVFGSRPVYLEQLTPEIETDAYLAKKQISAKEMEDLGGTVTALPEMKADRTQAAGGTGEGDDPPPPIPEDLTAVDWNDLRKLAKAHQIDTPVGTTREDVEQALAAKRGKEPAAE